LRHEIKARQDRQADGDQPAGRPDREKQGGDLCPEPEEDGNDGIGELDSNTNVRLLYGGNTIDTGDGDNTPIGGLDGSNFGDGSNQVGLSDLEDDLGDAPPSNEEVFEVGTTRVNDDVSAPTPSDPPTLGSVLTENKNANGTYGDANYNDLNQPIEGLVVHNKDVPDVDTESAVSGTDPADPARLGTTDSDNNNPTIYRYIWYLRIPTSVGNEIQGDRVEFQVTADVEQARNNANPFTGGSP